MVIKTGLISRVAFSVGAIDVYWYAVLIVLALIIGFLWSRINSGKFGVSFENIVDLAIFMLPVSFVSARLYYVLFNLDYYGKYPSEILDFKGGGLAIYGGIIGAVVTIVVFCKIKKIKILNLTDFLAPVLALGQAIGRWGNYINIEAYGTETSFPIKMEIVENGVTKYVHPTFLYESVCDFIIFLILAKLGKKRKFSGQLTIIYFACYGFIRFFIEDLRTDSLMLGSIRVSQMLSGIVFLVAVILYIIYSKKLAKCKGGNKL